MLTRWDEWYSEQNLSKDTRILATPASRSAEIAASEFLARGKQRILDLACGIGRDTFHLEKSGLSVIGVDASWNGLKAAQQSIDQRGAKAQLVTGDARLLPFKNAYFEGIYCFGLLHEFTSPDKGKNVRLVISEIKRVLHKAGILILTVAAGDPEAGLPQVQLFTRQMFEQTMAGWHTLEIKAFDDIGCTNRTDYHIWFGCFEK
jgi:ubiquinone/menaquinone biosynthesis C-methylase UbiE